MKKWMIWMLLPLLVLSIATPGIAEQKTLPNLDTYVSLYSVFAPLLEREPIEMPEVVNDGEKDIAGVFLENDVVIIFEFVEGTRNLSKIMVTAPTMQSDTGALGTFLYNVILAVQSANVITGTKEIMTMLQEFGLLDAESLENGILGSKEVDGILMDLLISEDAGGVFRLSNPE